MTSVKIKMVYIITDKQVITKKKSKLIKKFEIMDKVSITF